MVPGENISGTVCGKIDGEESTKEKKSGEIIFREGDRVMQTKNNYDLYWEKQEENGTGIFNGELGRIQKVNEEEKQISWLGIL